MIKKLCSYPGCHKVVEAGVKYCDKHRETDRKKYREYKQRRMRDEQEARRQQFYNSKAWEQFRAAQAAAQLGIDIYEYYTTGRIIDAENYHHIQEITEAWARRLDAANVIGLSEANHRRIHKEYDRRMFLNQHVALDHEKGAINMDLWDTCTKKVDTEDLKGWKCWGGLDLSSKNDITGFVLVFYEETTGRFIVVPYLYTPKETVAYRQHKDNNPYEYWIKKGDLIALDGKYINFDRFLDHATELDETYRIEQIGFDQWGSQTIINRLEDRWEVIPLGQGTKTMTQVINDFENLLVDERIIIAENECFRFMAKNCIAVYDEMLGVKYSKKKSKFKIDGIRRLATLLRLLDMRQTRNMQTNLLRLSSSISLQSLTARQRARRTKEREQPGRMPKSTTGYRLGLTEEKKALTLWRSRLRRPDIRTYS